MDWSRCVVEENIDAVRTNSDEGRRRVWFGAVIDAGVIAQLTAMGNLLLRASDRNGAAACEFRNLASDLPLGYGSIGSVVVDMYICGQHNGPRYRYQNYRDPDGFQTV